LWIPPFHGLEICRPAGATGSPYTTNVHRHSVVAHRFRLPEDRVTSCFGLPVTTIEQTWLMLASVLDIYDLIAAGDRALTRGASPETLAAVIASSPPIRGIRAARRALPHLDADSCSRPESRIRAVIVLAGLPKPAVNKPVFDGYGQWLAEPDLHYKEGRIALEYNGADHAGVQRIRKDGTRLLALQRAGWEVRTYTAPQAFRQLHEVVDDVLGLITVRAPELLSRRLAHRVTRMRPSRTRVRPSLGG
jgi:hypothetical protein